MASEYKIAIHIAGKLESSLNKSVSDANKQLGLLGKGGGKVIGTVGKIAAGLGKTTVGVYAATAAAMAAGAKYSVGIGKEFESAMASAAATAGFDKTTEEYARMEAAARSAGATTTKTSAEAANALEYMALAGWDVDTSIEALPRVLRLSEATGLDLAETSDLVTDSMSAMGVGIGDLTDYMDVLAKAQNRSNMNVSQEMDAFIKSGGILQSLGVGYEDAATVLGLMANNGLKGSEAGTALNAIMRNLTKTSGESADAMEALGLSMFDNGEFVGMETGLQRIHDALDGMTSEQQTQYLQELGGRYGSVLGLLLENFDQVEDAQGNVTNGWKDLSTEIGDHENAMESMRDIKLDTLQGDLDNLTSKLQDLGTAFYDAFGDDLRTNVSWLSEQLSAMSTAFQEGGWSEFCDQFSESFTTAATSLAENAPDIIDKIGEMSDSIVTAFGEDENAGKMAQAATNIVTSLSDNLLNLGGDIGETALTFLDEFVTAFANEDAVSKIWEASGAMIEKITQGFEEHGEDIANGAIQIVTQMAAAVPDMAEDLAGLAGAIMTGLATSFGENGDEIGAAAADLISGLATKIVENLPQIIDTGVSIVGGLLIGLIRGVAALVAAIPSLFRDVASAILNVNWLETGKKIVMAIWDGVKSLWGSFVSWLEGLRTDPGVATLDNGDALAAGWSEGLEEGTYRAPSGDIVSREAAIAQGGVIPPEGDIQASAKALEEYGNQVEATTDAVNTNADAVSGAAAAENVFRNALSETGETVNSDVQTQLSELGVTASAEGSNAGTGLSEGFAATAGQAVTTAQTTASNITSQFTGIAAQMLSIGQQIGNGLEVGMRSKIAGVQAAAAELANAAAQAAAAAAQIGSPSKITTEYGGFIGEGLIVGMRSMIGGVQVAATNLSDAATGTIHAAAQIGSPSGLTTGYGEFIGQGLSAGLNSSRGSAMSGISVDGRAGESSSITYSPVINVTGSNLTRDDVTKAMRMSMDDFDSYMKRWQKQRGRVAFA